MARERWFWAQGRQRRGPVLLPELVECALRQPDPRAVLVWRKGLAEWTRAADVPEVERRIASLVTRREAEQTAARPSAAIPSPAPPAPGAKPAGSNALVYGGIAAGIGVLGLLGWLLWPRPVPTGVPLGGTSPENAPAVVVPGGAPAAAPASPASPAPPAAATVAVHESELPRSELRKLRGVAAWSGETLRLTVYNGTAWRVTELHVRLARFDGQDLVEDPGPLRLLPPGGQVDADVADLLRQVAPDRRKAGINTLDTGPFEGVAGPRPENFRWEIESARGYAPSR